MCIAMDDKSQGSIAKDLSIYKFISQFASERIFHIGEHLAKLQAKWLFMSLFPFRLTLLFSKMQNLPDK